MPRILIVDDNPAIRSVLSRALRAAGYETIEADEGDHALEVQATTPAQLLLTDLVMNGKEGIETILAFKQQFPDVRIIAMSGGGRAGPYTYLDLAKGVGADRVFTKPLQLRDVIATIEELLPR